MGATIVVAADGAGSRDLNGKTADRGGSREVLRRQ
jgi:hypothetical protein